MLAVGCNATLARTQTKYKLQMRLFDAALAASASHWQEQRRPDLGEAGRAATLVLIQLGLK